MHKPIVELSCPISPEEIAWAAETLGLPEGAFGTQGGADRRYEILRSLSNLDVQACPGSGKTTLVVAKLAILARRWRQPRAGICVLSHTQVARDEIGERLGNSRDGRALLSFPHFVGTIHAFVDRYLALPWLRSSGFNPRVIDDAQCELHRRKLLRSKSFVKLSGYVSSKEKDGGNIVGGWRVASPAFDVSRAGKPEFASDKSESAKLLRLLARQCAGDGYYCYDEMFMWANNLLDVRPSLAEALQRRFPLVLLDEVQDNSGLQSALLRRVFGDGTSPICVRQRYGDVNQSIYGSSDESPDSFPNVALRDDIARSHRFGAEIATFASPFACDQQDLDGRGPSSKALPPLDEGQHTIFLFDPSAMADVLPAYCEHLRSLFTPAQLRQGVFTAVGAVHKRGVDDGKVPRHVGHYWGHYDPSMTGGEPHPRTLIQHIAIGLRSTSERGNSVELAGQLGSAMIRLVRLINPRSGISKWGRAHRQVIQLLTDRPDLSAKYRKLLGEIVTLPSIPPAGRWAEVFAPGLEQIALYLAESTKLSSEATAFLDWEDPVYHGGGEEPSRRDNRYYFPPENPEIGVRVGSIHSVKGETHTATLVLESYYKKWHLATLKPWLLGDAQGSGKAKPELKDRLRQHFVAMTRPSHLLCLALRSDHVSVDEVAKLKGRGWRVVHLTNGGRQVQ